MSLAHISYSRGREMALPVRSLSEKSSHNIMLRNPSPRESYSRRCPDAATRHSLLSGRPLWTDLRTCPKQSVHEAAVEKRKVYPGVQELVKKTFFPGIYISASRDSRRSYVSRKRNAAVTSD